MTQLSTETEDLKAHTAVTRAPSVNEVRRPGRRLSARHDLPPVRPNAGSNPGVSPISQGEDLWDEGRLAARSGNHEKAITCFVREAEARTAEGSHGRAAIAFRTAAEEARTQGQAELGDQLLDRAASAYTEAAGRTGLAPGTAHQAWISAAKCFLQLQQLDRAASCIEEARRVAAGTHRRLDPARSAS
ncbi:hypothetical protein [Pseudarthrobacter sulfonivorans]|uniref:hypothetical protein n=1 Tax=Pseudarthrobacter sulfonivorans TaxID=121292 RepID=UPI00285589A0|nr:hypothetical protein [Pseudarthrobacter sulfonivorans]MDR6413412.1 tetratricopeptide (TPR) repeat protein [Pseudarthrobacter sulfonivorans]